MLSEKNSVNDYESVSEIYEVKTIGVSPNESHINGYTQDISKVAKNVSYSNANMVNYNLNSGVTTFENFDPDSYSMKGQSETISLTTVTETTKISNLNISECDSILTSKAYVPDDAEVDYFISPNTIIGADDRVQVTNPKTYPIVFEEPVTRIQFYEKANKQYFNDNNRGRICIGNITFYTKEGNI